MQTTASHFSETLHEQQPSLCCPLPFPLLPPFSFCKNSSRVITGNKVGLRVQKSGSARFRWANSGHVRVTNIESRRTLVTQSVHEKLIRYVNRDQLSVPIKDVRIRRRRRPLCRNISGNLTRKSRRHRRAVSLRSRYVLWVLTELVKHEKKCFKPQAIVKCFFFPFV